MLHLNTETYMMKDGRGTQTKKDAKNPNIQEKTLRNSTTRQYFQM